MLFICSIATTIENNLWYQGGIYSALPLKMSISNIGFINVTNKPTHFSIFNIVVNHGNRCQFDLALCGHPVTSMDRTVAKQPHAPITWETI